MVKRVFANWKTTSLGISAIAGSVIHIIFCILHHTADETAWNMAVGGIIVGLGLIFAGDASHSEKNAAAIDQINQAGPDPSAPPLAPNKPNQNL